MTTSMLTYLWTRRGRGKAQQQDNNTTACGSRSSSSITQYKRSNGLLMNPKETSSPTSQLPHTIRSHGINGGSCSVQQLGMYHQKNNEVEGVVVADHLALDVSPTTTVQLPPAVMASQSSETVGTNDTTNESDNSDNNNNNNNVISTIDRNNRKDGKNHDVDDDTFDAYYAWTIIQERTPRTPEGLRPRKSAIELGRELNLPAATLTEKIAAATASATTTIASSSKTKTKTRLAAAAATAEGRLPIGRRAERGAQQQQQQQLTNMDKRYLTTTRSNATTSNNNNINGNIWNRNTTDRNLHRLGRGGDNDDDDGVAAVSARNDFLPPLPISSSWSTQGIMSSPPLSKNSLMFNNEFSRNSSSDHNVGEGKGIAESPHLLPGHARTAVGAIVAMQQQQQDHQQRDHQEQDQRSISSHNSHQSSQRLSLPSEFYPPSLRPVPPPQPPSSSRCRDDANWTITTRKEDEYDIDIHSFHGTGYTDDDRYDNEHDEDDNVANHRPKGLRHQRNNQNRSLDDDLVQRYRSPVQQNTASTNNHANTFGRQQHQPPQASLRAGPTASALATNNNNNNQNHPYQPAWISQSKQHITPRSNNNNNNNSNNWKHRRHPQQQSQLPPPPQQEQLNISHTSSQLGLISTGGIRLPERYEFAPVVLGGGVGIDDDDVVAGTEVILPPPDEDNLTNLSAMSQSAAAHDAVVEQQQQHHHFFMRDDEQRDDDEEDDYDDHDDELISEGTTSQHRSFLALDGALRRMKMQNQRRVREDLVLAVFERLQDDVKLVAEVQAIDGETTAVVGDWFVQTPLHKPGLLTGFDDDMRMKIIKKLNSIIDEMDNTSRQEDFFFNSPTMANAFAEPHNDLRQALIFCRTIVNMAIPKNKNTNTDEKVQLQQTQQESGQWTFLPAMRGALGIIPPESPEPMMRGGDTSFFSLPSDSGADTPMTSNVSMTTTITSLPPPTTPQPPNGQQQQQQPNNCHHEVGGGDCVGVPCQLPVFSDGLQVRRTIASFSAVLQKITMACIRLSEIDCNTPTGNNNGQQRQRGSAQEAIQVTEDIKKQYLQLLALDTIDLKALVDSFQFTLLQQQSDDVVTSFRLQQPLSVARKISDDDDDDNEEEGNMANNNLQQQQHHEQHQPRGLLTQPPPPSSVLRSVATSSNHKNHHHPAAGSSMMMVHQEHNNNFIVSGNVHRRISDQSTSSSIDRNRYNDTFSPPLTEDMRTQHHVEQHDHQHCRTDRRCRDREQEFDNDYYRAEVYDDDDDVNVVYDDDDDLRRQVGSTDYDDEEENREGPSGSGCIVESSASYKGAAVAGAVTTTTIASTTSMSLGNHTAAGPMRQQQHSGGIDRSLIMSSSAPSRRRQKKKKGGE